MSHPSARPSSFRSCARRRTRAISVVFVVAGKHLDRLRQGTTFTQSGVTTYTRLVATPSVFEPVIDELGWSMSPSTLAEDVSANYPLNTPLIKIQVRDENPEDAATIANALGRSPRETEERIETPVDGSTSPVRLTQVEIADVPTTRSCRTSHSTWR